jgi:hypothetical protein
MANNTNIAFAIIMFLLNIMLYGCGNMKKKGYIWSTIHSNCSDGTETDELFFNINFIKKCSPEIKTIISFYSKQYLHPDNYLYSNESDSVLATAL